MADISPADLLVLLKEVETTDPIDFADLPFKEEGLRELVAQNLCSQFHVMKENGFSDDDQLLTLLAISAKLVLENLILHARLLYANGATAQDSLNSLMLRLRKGGA